jgi:tetratricopeptide (TPR) repeat protein
MFMTAIIARYRRKSRQPARFDAASSHAVMALCCPLTTILRVPHLFLLAPSDHPCASMRASLARAACALLTAAVLSSPMAPAQAAGLCDGVETVQLATARLRQRRDDATALLCRARALTDQRDLSGALADLNRAAKLRPDDANVYIERARVFAQRNDVDQAFADYDRAIALKASARALRGRGELFAARGDLTAALADVEAAIKLQPTSSGLYVMRGELRARAAATTDATAQTFGGPALSPLARQTDAIRSAVDDFQFALKLDSKDAGALTGLARAQRDLAQASLNRSPERFADAIDSVNAALTVEPNRLDALLLKAELFALGEDHYNAQKLLLQVIERFPKNAEPHALRARIALDQRYYTAALDSASAALALDKTAAAPHCVRGSALEALGNRAQSRKAYEQCAALAKDAVLSSWAADGLKSADPAR